MSCGQCWNLFEGLGFRVQGSLKWPKEAQRVHDSWVLGIGVRIEFGTSTDTSVLAAAQQSKPLMAQSAADGF